MKKALVCSVCGHILLTKNIPDVCPSCCSGTKIFKLFDENIENGYKNISVTVGEIEHPMIKEHFISKISIYIDNELVSITLLTKDLKPETSIKVKTDSKNIAVVAQCNIHGSWITSI